MTDVDLRLALPACAAWAAAWLSLAGVPHLAAVLCLLLAVVSGLATRAARWLLLAVAGAALGAALSALVAGLAASAGPLPRLAAQRAAVQVELQVTGDPRVSAPKARFAGVGARSLVVLPARVRYLDARGARTALQQSVTVLADGGGWSDLLPGVRVAAQGRLHVGPDGGVVLGARGDAVVLRRAPAWQRAAGQVRAGLRAAVRGRGRTVEGLLPGVVLGDTSRLDPALNADARTTGLTHITAVSGFNVAIVLTAVLALVRRTRAGPAVQALLGLLAIVGFVVLARPSPSVLRAAVMGAIAMLALALGRPRAAIPALSGTVVVLLLVDPALARSYGFVLSALATAALLLVAPRWSAGLVARWGWSHRWAEAVAVPAAAHLVTAPVVAMISGGFSLVAIPANLLADPAVAPATLLGLGAALVSPLSPALAAALGWIAAWPVRWVAGVATVLAHLPAAALSLPSGGWGLVTAAGGLVGGAILIRRSAGRRAALVGVVAFLLARTAVAVVLPSWPPPHWALVVCDVGQGDAEVIATGPGHAVVLDSGPDPAPVGRCLDRLGVRAIDLMVLTHAHSDHLLGLPGVLSGRQVDSVWAGPLLEPKVIWDQAARWLGAVGADLRVPQPGEHVRVGPVGIDVLGPAHAFHGSHSDPNNSSLVLRVSTAGFTALLTGDAEAEAQSELMTSGIDLHADVLKIPHHGSRFQLPALLDAVGARVAVASVGAGNPYGHPAAETLQRLRSDGALVLRTDEDGSVAIAPSAQGPLAIPDHTHAPHSAVGALQLRALCGPTVRGRKRRGPPIPAVMPFHG